MGENLTWYDASVSKSIRVKGKNQRPCVIWFTGLSGAGKSTVANLLESLLVSMGAHTYLIDGDNIRHGLNGDLAFTDQDREENIRRVAEVSKLFVDAGLIIITAFISPFRKDRDFARGLVEDGEFIEVFIDTPLWECERRDPKGLYVKVRAGLISSFTGVDSDYEVPLAAELHVKTLELGSDEIAEQVRDYLIEHEYLCSCP